MFPPHKTFIFHICWNWVVWSNAATIQAVNFILSKHVCGFTSWLFRFSFSKTIWWKRKIARLFFVFARIIFHWFPALSRSLTECLKEKNINSEAIKKNVSNLHTTNMDGGYFVIYKIAVCASINLGDGNQNIDSNPMWNVDFSNIDCLCSKKLA